MKKIALMALFLVGLSITIFADDFKIPHRFKAGDVISADVLNEVLDYIDASKKTLTPSDLIGQWKCIKYKTNSNYPAVYPAGYQLSTSNLFVSLKDIQLNITEDSSGTIKWNSPSRNAFSGVYVLTDGNGNPTNRFSDECSGSGTIDSVDGDFAISSNNCVSDVGGQGPPTWLYKINITQISKNRLRINFGDTSLLCDLQNTPPSVPINLTVDSTGNKVNLSWTDNSSDETGFKIIRKDTLGGNWTVIATLGANSTSFTDNVTSGTHWYRVKAYNVNGDSLGSNVVKVDM